MATFKVTISQDETLQMITLAVSNRRTVPDHMAWIIKQHLKRIKTKEQK